MNNDNNFPSLIKFTKHLDWKLHCGLRYRSYDSIDRILFSSINIYLHAYSGTLNNGHFWCDFTVSYMQRLSGPLSELKLHYPMMVMQRPQNVSFIERSNVLFPSLCPIYTVTIAIIGKSELDNKMASSAEMPAQLTMTIPQRVRLHPCNKRSSNEIATCILLNIYISSAYRDWAQTARICMKRTLAKTMWFILAKFIPQRLYVATLSFSLGPLLKFCTQLWNLIQFYDFLWAMSDARDFDATLRF